jgi:hypothetical protein
VQGAGRELDAKAQARTRKALIPAREDSPAEPICVQEHTASTSIVRKLKAAAFRHFENDKRG